MPPEASPPTWSSKYEGWHSRSTPHDSPSTFTPTREALAFAVMYSGQADPEGFTLALFQPNIAVDAMGKVLVVEKDDFDGLTALAQKTPGLPQTGTFWNTWRIKQTPPARSEQVINRLLVATSKDGSLVSTSVQGYTKERTALESPVGDINEFPGVLWELFGLFTESFEEYDRGGRNTELIDLVKLTFWDV